MSVAPSDDAAYFATFTHQPANPTALDGWRLYAVTLDGQRCGGFFAGLTRIGLEIHAHLVKPCLGPFAVAAYRAMCQILEASGVKIFFGLIPADNLSARRIARAIGMLPVWSDGPRICYMKTLGSP